MPEIQAIPRDLLVVDDRGACGCIVTFNVNKRRNLASKS